VPLYSHSLWRAVVVTLPLFKLWWGFPFCYRLVFDDCIYSVYIRCFLMTLDCFGCLTLFCFYFLFLRSLGFRIVGMVVVVVVVVLLRVAGSMQTVCS
jgi:hypothetical protein